MSECCTGLNGSHTQVCPENTGDRLTCWCCGGTFPAIWAALWCDNGSRCFTCEGDTTPCRAHVGRRLEDVREDWFRSTADADDLQNEADCREARRLMGCE